MASDVELRAAAPMEQFLVAGLMQFYFHDFSEIGGASSALFTVDPRTGAFPPYPGLANYWSEPGHLPFIIRARGEIAGFALINKRSQEGRAIDWNMGEFFVLRKFRREGLGTQAVRQLLWMQPGRWEVAAMARNRAASEFWPAAIAVATNVVGVEVRAGDGVHWSGPIWSFRAI